MKLEAQPTYWKAGADKNYQLGLCFSFLATSSLTARVAYTYDHLSNDNRVLMQLYFYLPI
jgi:hypothetical protein